MLVSAITTFAAAAPADPSEQPSWTLLGTNALPAHVKTLAFPGNQRLDAAHTRRIGAWTVRMGTAQPPLASMPGGCHPTPGLHQGCGMTIGGFACAQPSARSSCSIELEWDYWVGEYSCKLIVGTQTVAMGSCPQTLALQAPIMPVAEVATMAAFIKRGLAEAPNDFVALRGHQNASWQYLATVSFGPTFDRCNVDLDDETKRWGLECTSTERTTPENDLRLAVESAVNAALPPGFIFTRGTSDSEPDMTWANGAVSVWVLLESSGSGKTYYVITLDHAASATPRSSSALGGPNVASARR